MLRGGDDISVSGVFLSALAFCVAAAGECLPAAGQLSLALAVKNAGLTRVSIKDPSLVERVASPDTFVIGSPFAKGVLDESNIHYSDIRTSYVNKNGFVRYWDDDAKAPYLYNKKTVL